MKSIMNHNSNCPYEKYYSQQAGSGIGVIYKGAPYQRGHGIGSFLGGLFRSIIPLLSSGAKTVGKEVLRSGVGLISDMVNTRPADDSIRERLHEVTTNLKRKADNKIERIMKGSGYKRRALKQSKFIQSSPMNTRGIKKVKRKKDRDIFSD